MKVKYAEKAALDLELAFEWYEGQRRGLDFDFLESIENSISNIIRHPDSYRISHSNFHRCIVRRFPFSISYTIEDKDIIIIHSVFDNRQDPKKYP